ncbi:MAG TPA: leucyl aminopeptidase [Drouetiella sp.]
MKYKFETAALSKIKSDIVVVGVFQGEDLGNVIGSIDSSLANGSGNFAASIAEAASHEAFTGKSSQVVSLPTYDNLACKKLMLVGLGTPKDYKPAVSRKIAANMARRFSNSQMTSICFVGRFAQDDESDDSSKKRKKSSDKESKAAEKAAEKNAEKSGAVDKETDLSNHLRATVEGWNLGRYSFEKYKSQKDDKKPKAEMSVSFANVRESKAASKACSVGDTIANATNLARALIAEPASYMTPSRLAEEAKRIAKEYDMSCKILDVPQLEKLGMGSFLGVAKGADEPCKFIVMKYDADKAKKTVAIIGKGITFDSGGLSLKPAASMEHMKYDMAGAAAILGAMQVIGELKPGVSVLGLIAATENMPGGNALHPGDVLTAMNGKTIEVNNTDAEGRLVLADAMTYASRQNVDEMIDLATLTGAVVTALGRVAAGIMGSNQELIDNLIAAGSEAGEKLWQLPLYDEYKDALKSDIADLKNAGARGEAASCAAAMFLKEFADGKSWAHLDIAGPGWLDKDRDECNKGGTAFGVRTLCQYILNYA